MLECIQVMHNTFYCYTGIQRQLAVLLLAILLLFFPNLTRDCWCGQMKIKIAILKLQCWEHPWKLALTSTLSCRKLTCTYRHDSEPVVFVSCRQWCLLTDTAPYNKILAIIWYLINCMYTLFMYLFTTLCTHVVNNYNCYSDCYIRFSFIWGTKCTCIYYHPLGQWQ